MRIHQARIFGRCVVAACAVSMLANGCGGLRHANTSAFLEPHRARTTRDSVAQLAFKTAVLYPARDLLTLDWLWRAIFGDEAWNAMPDGVADGSFFTNRAASEITPECLTSAWASSTPRPPFTIEEAKSAGASAGFVGHDADGRRYLFKLDDPEFPELGSSAAVIGARILWALGYNAPHNHVVSIQGTGDRRFDGHRGVATAYLDDVIGHWKFDWFRYRREVRGLRMACAWINDVDRVATNTLITTRGGQAAYYLIDFNSCLGSWQGRPKPVWRGRRYASDLFRPTRCDSDQPVVSAAVGRFDAEFDPLAWRSQFPNTAFDHMTHADLLWIASKIRRLDRARLEAIVDHARFSDPGDAEYVLDTLLERRKRILDLADSLAAAESNR
jgi:hypothetical protein